MRGVFYILIIIAAVSYSCGSGHQADNARRVTDSLDGAVNAAVAALRETDTNAVERGIVTYRQYSAFIRQAVNDTVSRTEGDDLQRFIAEGARLEKLEAHRRDLVARGQLIHMQLQKLRDDMVSNRISGAAFDGYFASERSHAGSFIRSSAETRAATSACLESLRFSARGIEQLIRRRNNGQLPTIVTDSIPF